MTEQIYDLITIGGGPAGLICAITGATGIPINSSGLFSSLIIEEGEIGNFAKYGKLRVTHKWFFMGHKVMNFLAIDAKEAGVQIIEHEKVIEVNLKSDIKTIKTNKDIYKGKKIAICTGFFPHGNLVKFTKNIRVMFSPIELEATFLPEEKDIKILILGGGHGTAELALKLKSLRPDIKISVIMEEKLNPEVENKYEGLKIHYGSVRVKKESSNNVECILLDEAGNEVNTGEYRKMLVDYNSYTMKTKVTDFLKDSGIILKEGYIKADNNGNTGICGVVAAGNIVTPVSGVITALSTGFTAGLNLYTQLYQEKYNKTPLLFPWLPIGDPLKHPLGMEEKVDWA